MGFFLMQNFERNGLRKLDKRDNKNKIMGEIKVAMDEILIIEK